MNSRLYECRVMHYRVKPVRHKFVHNTFMFYLDLDELDDLSKKLFLMGRNARNIFNFVDKDHLDYGKPTVKANVLEYIRKNGVDVDNPKVMLLTNLRTCGYIFNPVSFYFCFDNQDKPICAVAEVCNTFRELKTYFFGPETFDGQKFHHAYKKYFYISPFVDLDMDMDFQLKVPEHRVDLRINDFRKSDKLIFTSLSGTASPLNNRSLWWYGLKFPFITLKVMFLIHYHAAILHYRKKVPYHKKSSNPHLQREVQRVHIQK